MAPPPPSSNGGFSRPVTQAIEKLTREIGKLLAEMQRQNRGSGSGGGTGGGNAPKTAGGAGAGRTWWEFAGGAKKTDSPADRAEAAGRAKFGAALGVGGLAVSGAVTSLNPMLTSQEKQAQFAQGAGGVVGGGIGAVLGNAVLPGIGGLIGSQLGSSLGSSLGGLFGQKDSQVMQEAKGGFGDLREMAKAGYKISDEMMAKRADFEVGAAQRGHEFDKRTASVLSKAGEEGGQPGAFVEALNKLVDVLTGMAGGGSAAGLATMFSSNAKGARIDVEARRS